MADWVKLKNDEPVSRDSLGRDQLLNGLVSALEHCETPFVMAINGGWGAGNKKCTVRGNVGMFL